MKVHFIGIGGIGMSGIAHLLHEMGHEISGSDIEKSVITQNLSSKGIKIFFGHSKFNVKGVNLVVVSSAIGKENCELKESLKRKIPVKKRAEMLAEIAAQKKTITISGSHGKTTTASMISSIFAAWEKDYTAVVGGIFKNIGSNVKTGGGEYFICEADESDSSFLYFSPLVACVTSVDDDHLDHYKSMLNLKESFIKHINKVPFYGRAILCLDDEGVFSIIRRIDAPVYTYGIACSRADWLAKNIQIDASGSCFDVFFKGAKMGRVEMSVCGRHNVLNALCSAAASHYLGVNFKAICKGLKDFKGVKRRLEEFAVVRGVRFIDDYAHHPTEIKNVISAVKEMHASKRVVVLFQPHRYTRTELLARQIAAALSRADLIYLMNIYPAGEKPIKGIDSSLILKHINGTKSEMFANTFHVAKNLCRGDVFISMGAGDVWKSGEEVKLRFEMLG